jgi:hypothetical protein
MYGGNVEKGGDRTLWRRERTANSVSWCGDGYATTAKAEGNINADKYISILGDNIWPVIWHFPGNGYLFQDDNAPVHRARSTKEYVARTRLKNISWPAKSPDLNVIENIWLYIKAKLEIRIHKINSNSDLFWEIFRIWQTILLTCIKLTNLYDSFPRRILNVITMKGHLTKY